MEAIQAEIISFAVVLIAGLVGLLTQKITAHLKSIGVVAKINNNKELAKIVVGAVEQTYNHLGGNEKLNVAKVELIKLAQEKGIKISESDLDLLIESTVREMNTAIKQELK